MVNNKYNYQKYFSCFEATKSDIDSVEKSLIEKDISFPHGVTRRLESGISEFFNVNYTLAHCNGTSAMLSAMYGIGVKGGDEIICPSYSWWSSIAPALMFGAIPVFCEISPDNLTIDPCDIEKKITNKTKAIIVPHLWGNYGDILKVKNIIKKNPHKIFIIEDISHTIGAAIGDRLLGSLGDVAIFSLQANKILTAGEGGMLMTNNNGIYERAVYIGHYERINDLKNKKILKYKNTGGGFKFRINPLGAALALSQLSTLKKRINRQNELVSYFESKLKQLSKVNLFNNNPTGFKRGGIISLKAKIKLNKSRKEDIVRELEKCLIKREFFSLLHLEPLFTKSKARFIGNKSLPKSEELYKDLFSLPVFYRGSKKIIDEYIRVINKLLSD